MSSDEKEKRERILAGAEGMFLEHGYAKVTMEEIASSLGISKKTLYKFFPNKEKLVRDLISDRQCEFMNHIDGIWRRDDLDFIGKFRITLDYFGERSSRVNRFHDLQKLVPDVWKDIHSFKKEKGLEKIKQVLNDGFETGILRKDINRDVIVLLYTNAVESIITPDVLAELPFSGPQVFEAISKIIFEGILTEDGRKRYCSYSLPQDKKIDKSVLQD
ncbi:MAG TPA: TetR/AcrR family transcriptional regulator [Candidatus Kryptonia bacterium]